MLLELLHLADSALPVGAAAHSFGLETLVEQESLGPESLDAFFRGYLAESGRFEAAFVRRAWRSDDLLALRREWDARRAARECREAALKIGRRFTGLFHALTGNSLPPDLPYPIAFGAACFQLGIPEDYAVQAYLQQSVTGLISACQRLMPLGQVAAGKLLWSLRPVILDAVADSERLESTCFTPLTELGSMRHASMETRLFIS